MRVLLLACANKVSIGQASFEYSYVACGFQSFM